METIHIPTEAEIKKWMREALEDYFVDNPMKIVPPATEPEGELLNRKGVAGMFEITLVTLHEWMNKGLPFHRQGGRIYFLRSEIMQYVKEKTTGQSGMAGKYVKMNKYNKAV